MPSKPKEEPTIINGVKYFPVMLPVGYAGNAKRKTRYCKTKTEAKELHSDIRQWWINKRRPQDTFRASESDLYWIGWLKSELGNDLSRLRDIIPVWRAATRDVKEKIRCEAAADRYVEWRAANSRSETTLKDIRSRMNRFKVHFFDRPLVDLAPADIREYLETRKNATSRHNDFKILSPFLKWAKIQRLIAINPLAELTKPPADVPEPLRLTVEAFSRLLKGADTQAREVLAFLVLAGFGGLRTSELCPPTREEEALKWEDIQWDRKKIHIRPEVAKITKRKTGGRRYVDLEAVVEHFLKPIRREAGRVIPMTQKMLFRRLKAVENAAGVTIPKNGLRHSYCSYWLAAHRDKGFSGLSMNAGSGEAVLRKHYTEILPESDGHAYFALRRDQTTSDDSR